MHTESDYKLAVLGLGYVGLPLAVEFGKHFDTLGFDIQQARIEALRAGRDHTGEVDANELAAATHLRFGSVKDDLRDRNVYVVAVPTPVDEHKRADFGPLLAASRTIGDMLSIGDLVIYESTVYPGATEEICVPELESASGLSFNIDFTVGYSPERINPGDRTRRLTNIPKITSGSTPEAAEVVDALYRRIIIAGTHKAPSLKVAEAAKVIENTQRDLNIALMNELAIIFNKLGLDTNEVLTAARTKWNFLPFSPGLVGGHCIGVDPYYLIQKAQSSGYYPDILLACRRINDSMGQHVAAEVVKLMIGKGHAIKGSRILVLGLAFKENCPDLRNTRVVDLVSEFKSYGAEVDVHDAWVSREEAEREFHLPLLEQSPSLHTYDAVVLAVAHRQYIDLGERVRDFGNESAVIYDIKGVLPRHIVDGRL